MADPAYPPPPPPTYADPTGPPPPAPTGPPPVYSTGDQYGMPQTAQTHQPYAAPMATAYANHPAGHPAGYPAGHAPVQQHHTVVINQVHRGGMYGHGRAMYHMPTLQTCPQCNTNSMTRVESKLSGQGWVWVIMLALLGCWPWCLLPLCMPGCKDHTHYCSSCNAQVGGRTGGM